MVRQIEGSMRRTKDKRKQEREAKRLYPYEVFLEFDWMWLNVIYLDWMWLNVIY